VAPFQREERYIVLKINRLSEEESKYWRDCQSSAKVNCVVVEHDWPEYEPVWRMIERRMTGQPAVSAAEELDAVLHWRAKHAQAVRERDALQVLLTAADERADVLEGLLRLARGAFGENQWTLLTKDIDAMLSHDSQQTNNSGNAHCPHDGICHTSEETCAEAQARIESLTAQAGAGQ